jgi:hypothetical protein
MALVLARFLYGFCLSWIVVAVLIAATLLCIRLVGIAVVAFDEERKGDIAGALCVAAVIAGALAAMAWLGHRLYDALGTSSLVGGTSHWLAGGNTLSPAAIFGALAGFGILAGLRGWMNRPPKDPAEIKAAAAARAAAKAAKAKAAKVDKPAVKSSADKSRTAAARKAGTPARGPRIPQLGWAALFLLLLGGAVFAFAYGVDPLSLPPNATAAMTRLYQEMAVRARPIYLVAAGLLGAGVLFTLVWFLWRRKPLD